MTDKLAADSKVRKGSKQSHVNAARVRGKLPHLIRGGLPMRAEVSRGHSSRWSNDHPGQRGKPIYRAKGQTDKELSRKACDTNHSRYLESWGERGEKAEGRKEADVALVDIRHPERETAQHEAMTSSYLTEPPDADPHVRWCGRGVKAPLSRFSDKETKHVRSSFRHGSFLNQRTLTIE